MPLNTPPRSGEVLDHRPSPLQIMDRESWPATSPIRQTFPGGVSAAEYASGESLVTKKSDFATYSYAASPTLSSPARSSLGDAPAKPAAGAEASAAKVSHARRVAMFVGLFFTIFLSGLDQTVTSTILTHIANDFKALDHVEWVPTIFMLCSTSISIVSGRVADIFGRFPVLMFSLLAFVAGAVVSASAQGMIAFIAARGLSGIACGSMLNLSIIIISDIVPIEQRGAYLGILQICFGISNAAGPLLGGVFADRINWRAAFVADMVMGLVTVVYLALVLRLPRVATAQTWSEGLRSLDYLGIFLFVGSITLAIVGLNIGGTILLWSSPVTIGCLAAGCVLLGAFVAVELRLATVPLVPMWLFTVRNLVIAFLVTFFCGMTMFSIIFYMPVYFSAVFGATAMQAGLYVLPFGIALSFSSFASGYFMTNPKAYRTLLRAGPAIMAAGVLMMALFGGRASQTVFAALLLVPGAGMGNVIVSNVIAAQACTDARFIATVTPICEFFLSIGGVIGVAVFGAVHRNCLSGILAAAAVGETPASRALLDEARRDVSVIHAAGVPEYLRTTVTRAYAASMTQALWVMLPLLALALILALALERTPAPATPDIPLEQIDDM
ncbi:hypothetical protein H4R19_001172 [Coemansia spiralis]|nr:hypothetical protein H4R19_001172 [Coemansia spiralis]